MTMSQADLTSHCIARRYIAATEQSLRQTPDREFANDGASVVFAGGNALSPAELADFSIACDQSHVDVIYLEFAPGHPERGPQNVIVIAERDGIVFRWSDCSLWAPADGGPFLIMPRGLRVCFGYDGLALISYPDRPTTALGDGFARARSRLRFAERGLTAEQLAKVVIPGEQLAA